MFNKRWLFFSYLVISFGSIGYMITNNYQFFESSALTASWLDNQVPFLVWTVPFYLMIFPSIVAIPWLLKNENMFRRSFWGSFILCVSSLLVFVVFPTHINEREMIAPVIESSSFWKPWYGFVYQFDTANNCLPSFHVSMGVICTLMFYKERPIVFWVYFVMAILVAVSTLTMKQHYFVDVLGGVVFGILSYLIALKIFPIKK